jgi:coenzyme PQQ synthesis protein D (PqqD)
MTQHAVEQPKRDEMVVINDEAEVPSILHPITGKIFITNRVGVKVMELADGSRTLDEIADRILGLFPGAERDVVHREVEAFLAESARKGLIAWS